MQRLRFTFARGDELKYVSHLDLARLWERALRRAGLPLAYSAGFTPHARISFALPLAVGVTGGAELVEVYFVEAVAPAEAQRRLAAQLPRGLSVLAVAEEDAAAPSLQARVRAADYVVGFPEGAPGLVEAVGALLARDSVLYERQRGGAAKKLDLRPYVESLVVGEVGGRPALTMRLRVDAAGAARPDEVLSALGLAGRPARIHRVGLHLAR